MPRTKKRTYKEAFLQWGFTRFVHHGIEKPQCMLCNKVLTSESKTARKLKHHFEKSHTDFIGKDLEFFKRKEEIFKSSLTDSVATVSQSNEPGLEASYRIALHIAENKKSHTIGEELIKPCLLDAVKLVLGEQHMDKINEISLSSDTVKSHMEEMSLDILDTVLTEIKSSPYFALQLDVSTDVTSCFQLIVYVRYIKNDQLKEDYLFSKSLRGILTRVDDVYHTLRKFIEENELQWSKLVDICADGASFFLGVDCELPMFIKHLAPHVTLSHCIIDRYALAVKTLPHDLMIVISDVLNIIDHIRGSATKSRIFKMLCEEIGAEFDVLLFNTKVRWLSQGNVLLRIFVHREEIALFLARMFTVSGSELHKKMTNKIFIAKLAYLADFFGEIDRLNRYLQWDMVNLLTAQDKVASFLRKLELFQRRVQVGDDSYLIQLSMLLEKNNEKCTFMTEISQHLSSTIVAINDYFPDLESRQGNAWVLRPFTVDDTILPDSDIPAKVEFLGLRENNILKIDFESYELVTFWAKAAEEYPIIAERALKILIPFAYYSCERAFSTMVAMKTKSSTPFTLTIQHIEHDLRCALAKTKPNIKRILQKKLCQSSH